MDATTSDTTVRTYPCLMMRTMDDAIVLVTDLADKENMYQVTILTASSSMGTSYTSRLGEDDYKHLPAGFRVTLTN